MASFISYSNPEVLNAIEKATGIKGGWSLAKEETRNEWVDGAREWYFDNDTHNKRVKAWYTRGRHIEVADMA